MARTTRIWHILIFILCASSPTLSTYGAFFSGNKVSASSGSEGDGAPMTEDNQCPDIYGRYIIFISPS